MGGSVEVLRVRALLMTMINTQEGEVVEDRAEVGQNRKPGTSLLHVPQGHPLSR